MPNASPLRAAPLATPLARENLRGAGLMVLAMALFAVEDAMIKSLATRLPVGEILALLGIGGASVFGILSLWRDGAPRRAALLHPAVIARTLAEALGTVFFVSALALAPLATVSAILQAVPLAVTLGAALVLKEQVGWRRWSAILVGFAGVLIIVRPWSAGFEPAALLAVFGVAGLAARDVATRAVPATVSTLQLSALAFAGSVVSGLLLMAALGTRGVQPGTTDIALLALTVGVGVVAYATIVAATRIGEIATVAPFRYARILFALVLAVAIFDERPDAATLAGSAIVVASGLYAFFRERARARAAFKRTLPRL